MSRWNAIKSSSYCRPRWRHFSLLLWFLAEEHLKFHKKALTLSLSWRNFIGILRLQKISLLNFKFFSLFIMFPLAHYNHHVGYNWYAGWVVSREAWREGCSICMYMSLALIAGRLLYCPCSFPHKNWKTFIVVEILKMWMMHKCLIGSLIFYVKISSLWLLPWGAVVVVILEILSILLACPCMSHELLNEQKKYVCNEGGKFLCVYALIMKMYGLSLLVDVAVKKRLFRNHLCRYLKLSITQNIVDKSAKWDY